MAMQTGIGVSKIVILVGAGYTSTILFKNGKLSDIIGELQLLVKGLEKHGEQSDADPDYSDAIAAQVRRLAMEVRQMASARQITVLNGSSGQLGNLTSLVVPAATLGVVGYGYMWWKGFSFSDLMYVTKRNMSTAVSNLTKHLEQVSEALAATKRHLTQRIENLDGKLNEQVEISKLIKNDVTAVGADVSLIGDDLKALQSIVSGLDGKIDSLEWKQDFTNYGVEYLCNTVKGIQGTMPEGFLKQLEQSGRSRAYLTSSGAPTLMGLKEIVESLESGTPNKLIMDGTVQDSLEKVDDRPRRLMRMASTKC